MKAIYELRKRVKMHEAQAEIHEIIANNIFEAVEIANTKYNANLEKRKYDFGSPAGIYYLVYRGTVK